MRECDEVEKIARAIMECRLSRWSIWEIRENENGLGYPKRSPFSDKSGSGSWEQEDNSEEWETGQAIKKLDNLEKMAIRAKWILPGRMVTKYSVIGITKRDFYRIYNCAVGELIKALNN